MTLEESKNNLKTNGYCWFNLKDFNTEYYDYVYKYLKCSEFKNLKEAFCGIRTQYRITKNSEQHMLFKEFENFAEVNLKKEQILNEAKHIEQMWLYSEFNKIEKITEPNVSNSLQNITNDIIRNFYNIDSDVEINNGHMQFTYYSKGCRLSNHSDGTDTGRICACLIYFNENYESKFGGNLILNNTERIVPEIGNVAIIDLQSFDIKHMVDEVLGGPGRFAFLSFPSIGEVKLN